MSINDPWSDFYNSSFPTPVTSPDLAAGPAVSPLEMPKAAVTYNSVTPSGGNNSGFGKKVLIGAAIAVGIFIGYRIYTNYREKNKKPYNG